VFLDNCTDRKSVSHVDIMQKYCVSLCTLTTHVDLRFDEKMPKLPAIINCIKHKEFTLYVAKPVVTTM